MRKLRCGSRAGWIEKEFFHAVLAIGQPVAQKGQISHERRLFRNRMMRRGIESVVDRNALAGAESFVRGDDRRPPAIGQNDVEGLHRTVKCMIGVCAQIGQRCRRIHVPENANCVVVRGRDDSLQEFIVEHADTVDALITTSASRSLRNHVPWTASAVAVVDFHDRAHSGGSMSRCFCRSNASGS